MSNTIHQEIRFDVPVEKVYAALTQTAGFSGFTGKPAKVSDEAGAEFQGFDAMVSGRNVEMVPHQRVVQAWRVETWPAGLYSIVRFEFTPIDGGTVVILDQAGFPQDAYDHLDPGWHKMYWEPLKAYLN